MSDVRSDLVICLNEAEEKFILFLKRKNGEQSSVGRDTTSFTVEISFEDIKSRGVEGGKILVGESVLGVFEALTDGRFNLLSGGDK
jgi:hypothetical protein